MNYNIRKGVFETNSSSMHTIAIDKTAIHENPAQTRSLAQWDSSDGQYIFNIRLGEYGWGYDELTTTTEKLNYLFTMTICNLSYSINIENVSWEQQNQIQLDIIQNTITSWENHQTTPYDECGGCWQDLRELCDLVHQIDPNVDSIKIAYSEDYYIDHQSMNDNLNDFCKHNEIESLYDFLVNEKYVIIITNDNEDDIDKTRFEPIGSYWL